MFHKKSMLLLLPTLILAACGGGNGSSASSSSSSSLSTSSSSSNSSSSSSSISSSSISSSSISSSSSSSSVATATGVFVDSAVAGIGYRTATQEGITNENGEYRYVQGETVVFFIGDIELPPVSATGVVTPRDVFQTESFEDQRVVNLARLLQSLDQDGNPDNGIAIAEAAHANAADLTVDFDVPTATFETNTSVVNLVSNGGGNGTLVSAEDALAHIQQSSIVGGWAFYDDGVDLVTITFMKDGTYMMAHQGQTDDSGQSGVEYGTYSWNPATRAFAASPQVDTNGEWGLSSLEGLAGTTAWREGDKFILSIPEDTEESRVEFDLATSATNPIVGGWVLTQEGPGAAVIVFLGNGDFTLAQATPADEAGEPGNEIGTYNWNPETGAISMNYAVDTNGEWGFSDSGIVSATVGEDVLTLNDGTEDVPFERVDGIPGIALDLVMTNTLVDYNQGELFEVGGATMQCSFSMAEGESEIYNETWVLNTAPGRSSYLVTSDTGTEGESEPISYNASTGVVSFSHEDTEEVNCEGCTTTYYVESLWSWEATFNPDAAPIISGEVTETIKLTWDINDSVSICTGTYEMTAVLAEQIP